PRRASCRSLPTPATPATHWGPARTHSPSRARPSPRERIATTACAGPPMFVREIFRDKVPRAPLPRDAAVHTGELRQRRSEPTRPGTVSPNRHRAPASNPHTMRGGNMARTIEQQSRAAYSSGIRGLVSGAVIGAILMAIAGLIFGMFNFGSGSVPLHMAAGACIGAIIGVLYGMIHNRR